MSSKHQFVFLGYVIFFRVSFSFFFFFVLEFLFLICYIYPRKLERKEYIRQNGFFDGKIMMMMMWDSFASSVSLMQRSESIRALGFGFSFELLSCFRFDKLSVLLWLVQFQWFRGLNYLALVGKKKKTNKWIECQLLSVWDVKCSTASMCQRGTSCQKNFFELASAVHRP